MAKRKLEDSPSFDEKHVSLDNNTVLSQINCDAITTIEPRIIKYLDPKTNKHKTIKISRIENDTGQDTLKILVTNIPTYDEPEASCEYEFKNIKESGYENINNHLMLHLIGKDVSHGSNCQRYCTHIIPGEYVNLGGPGINIGEYIKIGHPKNIHNFNSNKKYVYRLQQIIRGEDTETMIILVQNISDPDSKLIIREFQTINKTAYDTLDNHMMLHIIGAIGDYTRYTDSCRRYIHTIDDKYKISHEDSNIDEASLMFPHILKLAGDDVFPFSEIDASLMQ